MLFSFDARQHSGLAAIPQGPTSECGPKEKVWALQAQQQTFSFYLSSPRKRESTKPRKRTCFLVICRSFDLSCFRVFVVKNRGQEDGFRAPVLFSAVPRPFSALFEQKGRFSAARWASSATRWASSATRWMAYVTRWTSSATRWMAYVTRWMAYVTRRDQ